jgi:hypothetical protein
VGAGVVPGLEAADLAEELAVAVEAVGGQPAVRDGREDGATGLGLVGVESGLGPL